VLSSKLGWSKEYPSSISHELTQYFQANVNMQHKFPPRPLPYVRFALSFNELLNPGKPKLLIESLNKLQMTTCMEMLCGSILIVFIQSCYWTHLQKVHTVRTCDSCSLLIRSKSLLRHFVESFCKEPPVSRFRYGFPNTLT
jgi:hypothetical protein